MITFTQVSSSLCTDLLDRLRLWSLRPLSRQGAGHEPAAADVSGPGLGDPFGILVLGEVAAAGLDNLEPRNQATVHIAVNTDRLQ